MIVVEMMLTAAFWAVPAFMRVDPLMISLPVPSKMGCSAASRIGVDALFAIAIVSAPRARATSIARKVNGVRPLAATATTTSAAFTACSAIRSEEHTSELQSLMRISYAGFCLKKKIITHTQTKPHHAVNIQYINITRCHTLKLHHL